MSALVVFMDGRRCGTVRQSRTGDLGFTYDEGYRSAADATPLSLSMPLTFREHRKRAIYPFLEGLLTDNATARRALAVRYGVSANSAFALLTHIGRDVAGALQFVPDHELSTDGDLPRGGSTELSVAQVATLLHAVVDEFRDGRPVPDAMGRFSLAGAQPKIALIRTGHGTWARATGATPTTHILKPMTGGYRRLDVVEHLTMRAAARLGLDVAKSELTTIGPFPTFVVRRYDRVYTAVGWRRLHQEDLCQALGVLPDKKYQRDDGGPGVARIGQLLRGLPRAGDRSVALEGFFRALMFATITQCTDAHAKNYSLLLSGSSVRLAPLYDLATFAPYSSPDQPAGSAMKIGREYLFASIGERECLGAAKTLRIPGELAHQIITEFRASVSGAFESARDELGDVNSATKAFADEVVGKVSKLPLVR